MEDHNEDTREKKEWFKRLAEVIDQNGLLGGIVTIMPIGNEPEEFGEMLGLYQGKYEIKVVYRDRVDPVRCRTIHFSRVKELVSAWK